MRQLQEGEPVVTFVTTRAGNQKRTVTVVTRITARDIVLRGGQRFRRDSVREDSVLGTCYFNTSRGIAESALGLARLSAFTALPIQTDEKDTPHDDVHRD